MEDLQKGIPLGLHGEEIIGLRVQAARAQQQVDEENGERDAEQDEDKQHDKGQDEPGLPEQQLREQAQKGRQRHGQDKDHPRPGAALLRGGRAPFW